MTRQGAIPRPTSPRLLARLRSLEEDFPVAAVHRRLFRALGSEYVFADRCNLHGNTRAWLALVRFGHQLEHTFGFTRELLVFYSPHPDLQVRSLQAIKDSLKTLPRDVDPDVAFLFSRDPSLVEKADDWSTARLTLLPLPQRFDTDESAGEKLLDTIRTRIFSRDLYFETTPVSGERFFGRGLVVQSLLNDLNTGRVPGLFGLRKSGKTSLLYELRHQLNNQHEDRLIFILRDLEALPSPPNNPIPDLLIDLREDFSLELQRKRFGSHQLAGLSKDLTVAQFRRGLQGVLRQFPEAHFILALDEIEYLVPPDKTLIQDPAMQDIAQLLGALRALVQENSNFTFVVSGLTSWIIELGRLYTRPNPLFSWAKPYFVSPLTLQEAGELAIVTGRKMGIDWTADALREIHRQSGGHAYLFRSLASSVVKSLPITIKRRRIDSPQVVATLPRWRREVAGNFKEILDHLAGYYPDESFLFELLQSSPNDFQELAEQEPQSLHRLLSLGIIEETEQGFFRSRIGLIQQPKGTVARG